MAEDDLDLDIEAEIAEAERSSEEFRRLQEAENTKAAKAARKRMDKAVNNLPRGLYIQPDQVRLAVMLDLLVRKGIISPAEWQDNMAHAFEHITKMDREERKNERSGYWRFWPWR